MIPTSPSVSPNLMLSARCPPCVHAAFQQGDDNPLLSLCNGDSHGEYLAFDFKTVRPLLVDVTHSRPSVVYGNHRHRCCNEMMTVLSGALDIYLLCACPGRHVFRKRMEAGASVHLPSGTAHAVHTLAETEIISVFTDGDPRLDRERIELIYL